VQGFTHAFRGLYIVIRTERNFQVQLIALIMVISAGFYLRINASDWIILTLNSALVMSLELINTAIEKLCDDTTSEIKPSIRNIKDIAAGAVLLASIAAIVIAVLLFWKYLAV